MTSSHAVRAARLTGRCGARSLRSIPIIASTSYVVDNFNPEIVTISSGPGVVKATVTSGSVNAITKNTVTNTVVATTTAVSNAPTNVDRPNRVAIPNLMTL